MSDSCWRSLVGSPCTSMKCAECVTGSNTMMNCVGNCSDSTAFSPAGSSSASSTTSSVSGANDSSLRSIARAPEHLLVIFPERQRIGIMRRDAPDPGADGKGDLDLLVDRGLIAAGAQSAIDSRRGAAISASSGHRARRRSRGTARSRSDRTARAARHAGSRRSPALRRARCRAEKSSTLIRLSSWSSPFSISCAIASATAGSAVCFRTENWAWVSLMLTT